MTTPKHTSYTPGTGLPTAIPPGSTSIPAFSQVNATSPDTRKTNTPATSYPEITQKRRRRIDLDLLRQLAEVMPERDHHVLDVIAKHRFLTTHQIQQFAFTSLGTPESAARTTRHVLQRLARTALIRPLRQRIGGVRAGSSARVWQLAPAGARLLRDNGTIHRTHEPSTRFLAHCLAVADVHLGLRELQTLPAVQHITVQIEPDSWRRYTGQGGEPRWLQPDLTTTIQTAHYDDRWFIEVDLGTESMTTLLGKCGQYEAYRRSGIEQHEHGAFPLVLWLFTKPARTEQLSRAISRSTRFTPQLYRFATTDTFQGVIREPLDQDNPDEPGGEVPS